MSPESENINLGATAALFFFCFGFAQQVTLKIGNIAYACTVEDIRDRFER